MSTNQFQRQVPRYIAVDLGVANMGAGNGVTAKLPQGAVVVAAGLLTVTAFNSATTATGNIGDGTTDFVADQDVKTTGSETVANVPKFYEAGGEIEFSLAETGTAATAGRAIGWVAYLILGAGDEVYG